MMRVITRRVFQFVMVIFTLVTVTFFLLRALPGSPFDSENAVTPIMKAQLEKKYHLNAPLLSQYVTYLNNLAHGDLGSSYEFTDESIPNLLAGSLPVTLLLGAMAVLFSFLVGVPIGLGAARAFGRWEDKVALIFISVGGSIPPFLVAPLLILIFSFWLDILPPALWQSPRYFVLPVVALSLRPLALIARLMRSSALDHLSSDFVRTARAQGVSEHTIVFKYILKNSLLPLLSIVGPLVAHILSASFIVELVFAIPGISHHFIDSVLDRDYPLVLTLALIYGIILSLTTLISDVLASVMDPRVKAL